MPVSASAGRPGDVSWNDENGRRALPPLGRFLVRRSPPLLLDLTIQLGLLRLDLADEPRPQLALVDRARAHAAGRLVRSSIRRSRCHRDRLDRFVVRQLGLRRSAGVVAYPADLGRRRRLEDGLRWGNRRSPGQISSVAALLAHGSDGGSEGGASASRSLPRSLNAPSGSLPTPTPLIRLDRPLTPSAGVPTDGENGAPSSSRRELVDADGPSSELTSSSSCAREEGRESVGVCGHVSSSAMLQSAGAPR